MTHAFTITLKAGNKLREFNFTRVPNTPNTCYSVDVVNDSSHRIGFRMQETGKGQWEIAHNAALPDWIATEKTKLDEALNEEVRKEPVPWSKTG